MIVVLQVLTVGTARPSHGEASKDMRMRTCDGQHSPEPSKWIVSSVDGLGALPGCVRGLWTFVDKDSVHLHGRVTVSFSQPRLERTGVETMRSRARTPH